MRRLSNRGVATLIVACGALLVLVVVLGWQVGGSRKADFGFAYEGGPLSDLRFSADGKQIALVLHMARIYSAIDGKVIRAIDANGPSRANEGERRCAWNASGTRFAISTTNGQGCSVLNTRGWNVEGRFSLCLAAAQKEQLFVDVRSLSFDRLDNLYMATAGTKTELTGSWESENPSLVHPIVWSNKQQGDGCALPFTSYAGAQFDMSIAGDDRGTLVAVSYWELSPVTIVRVRRDEDGRVIAKEEYRITELKAALVRLAADGKFLVAHDGERVYVFQLLENHQYRLIVSRDAPRNMPTFAVPALTMLDVSSDGHTVAYSSGSTASVMRIPDGQKLLEIPSTSRTLALSPDGKVLAVPELSQRMILFYRIVWPEHAG